MLLLMMCVAADVVECDDDTDAGVSLFQVSHIVAPAMHISIPNPPNHLPVQRSDAFGIALFLVVVFSTVILSQLYQAKKVERKGSTEPLSCEWGSPLHGAAAADDVSALRKLAVRGDVDFRDGYDQTPLHVAAAKGHKKAVSFLINYGADLTARDFDDATPLVLAGKHGHRDVVGQLLDEGATAGGLDDGSLPPTLAAAFLERLVSGY